MASLANVTAVGPSSKMQFIAVRCEPLTRTHPIGLRMCSKQPREQCGLPTTVKALQPLLFH